MFRACVFHCQQCAQVEQVLDDVAYVSAGYGCDNGLRPSPSWFGFCIRLWLRGCILGTWAGLEWIGLDWTAMGLIPFDWMGLHRGRALGWDWLGDDWTGLG